KPSGASGCQEMRVTQSVQSPAYLPTGQALPDREYPYRSDPAVMTSCMLGKDFVVHFFDYASRMRFGEAAMAFHHLQRLMTQHLSNFGNAGTVHCQIRGRKSTRLNSSHVKISYAVFCLKKK